MFVGIGATKLFLVFVAFIALLPTKTDGGWSWRIWSFVTAPPNEIGDTLAGIAGALAFLWIIVTVMMQSKELAAQREELTLTRKEFKKMAVAQESQVTLLVEQGKIFAMEQRQRLEDRTTKLLEQYLITLEQQILSGGGCIVIEDEDEVGMPTQNDKRAVFQFGDYRVGNTTLSNRSEHPLSDYLVLLKLALTIADSKRAVNKLELNYFDAISQTLVLLQQLDSNLPADQKERLRRLRVDEAFFETCRLTAGLQAKAPQ